MHSSSDKPKTQKVSQPDPVFSVTDQAVTLGKRQYFIEVTIQSQATVELVFK